MTKNKKKKVYYDYYGNVVEKKPLKLPTKKQAIQWLLIGAGVVFVIYRFCTVCIPQHPFLFEMLFYLLAFELLKFFYGWSPFGWVYDSEHELWSYNNKKDSK